MEEKFISSVLAICKILDKYSVQYLIVGGAAVALHGYFRYSTNSLGIISEKPDLDFWYNSTYKNYFNLLNALEELGQDITEFKNEQTPNPRKSFFRYELEQFTLDFLPELKAPLRFVSSFDKRETVRVNEIDISFINYDDLILDKKERARPKDMIDIEQLRNRRDK